MRDISFYYLTIRMKFQKIWKGYLGDIDATDENIFSIYSLLMEEMEDVTFIQKSLEIMDKFDRSILNDEMEKQEKRYCRKP